MGQGIFYCAKCLRRLTIGECEKGLGVRIGSRACCTECLPQLVASLSAEEQREFAKELAAQKKAARTELRRGSSVAVAPVRAAPHPSARDRSPWPLFLSLAGAGGALLLAVLLLLPRGSETRPPNLAPPVKAVEDGPTRAAREAVERARKSSRGDLDARIAAWAQAARLAQGTAHHKEARETHEALIEERKASQGREAAEVEARAQPLLDREDFGGAAEHFERAGARRDSPEWKALMDAKVRAVRARAEALFATLLQKSAEARRQGREDEVRAVRERVGRWKRPELAADLDRHLAGIAPAERPWKPIFDGKSLEFMQRASRVGWEVRDGALVAVVTNAGQTIAEFGDGELRIRFEAKEVDNVYFTLRRTPTEGFKAQWNTGAFRTLDGKTCELLFTARGESVTARLNGQPFPLESNGRPLKGILKFNARAKVFRIFSVEFRDLP